MLWWIGFWVSKNLPLCPPNTMSHQSPVLSMKTLKQSRLVPAQTKLGMTDGEPQGCWRRNRLGWSIVVIAFLVDAISLGGRGLFSVAILYFEVEFGFDRTAASSLKSVVHICIAIATIISGQVADTCPAIVSLGGGILFLALCYALISAMSSAWQAWLIYGVFTGCGWGFLNLNVFSVAVLKSLPERYAGTAIGIANTGSTFGMFALVPAFSLLAERYGWRMGYITLSGALLLAALPAIALLRALPGGETACSCLSWRRRRRVATSTEIVSAASAASAASPASQRLAESPPPPPPPPPPLRAKLRTLGTSRPYWLLSFAFAVCGLTTTGFIETHIVALAVSRGQPSSTGALAFSVLSACNGLGMLLAGWLSDRVSRSLTLCAIFGVRGLSFLLLLFARSGPMLFVFAAIFGLVDYSVVPPTVSLVGSHAGKHSVGLGVGILLAWHSLAAAGGAYLGGVSTQPSNQRLPWIG